MRSQAVFLLAWRLRQALRPPRGGGARAAARAVVLAGTGVVLWLGLFAFFRRLLGFIGENFPETGEQAWIHSYIFSVYFLVLLVMLAISNGVLLYGAVFRSRETAFLLAEPVRPDALYFYKIAETLGFSSWAFALLGTPLLAAYGVQTGRPAAFYPLSLVLLPPFLLLPAAVASVAVLLLVRFLPRSRRRVLLLLAMVLAAAVVIFAVRLRAAGPPRGVVTYEWVQKVFHRLGFTQSPLLPSHWMGVAVQAAGDDAGRFGFFLLELSAQALFALVVSGRLAEAFLAEAYSLAQGRRDLRRRWLPWTLGLLEGVAARALRPFPTAEAELVLKDVRSFLRDPVQWAQFLLFFGLLGLYFANLRSLSYNLDDPYWQNLLAFLNLSACCFTLATFTSRFVYPLLSLEGARLWVLGLAPISRRRIVGAKFAFSVLGSLCLSLPLVVLSDVMLRMPPLLLILHLYLIGGVCLGLSGISVGLGAFAPRLREDDPSRIVSGFGGLVNLLVSLGFVLLVIFLVAVPCHFLQARGTLLLADRIPGWLWGSLALATAAFGAAATVPLAAGAHRFERMEI